MSEDAGRKPDSRLHTIAGRWQTSGHVIDEPTIPVAGTDTYEVLPGGYFLLHHVDVTVGDKPVRAIEIIGEPDAASGGFLAPSFDDDGNTELMHVTIDDHGVFHFTGGAEVASAAHRRLDRASPIHTHHRRGRTIDARPVGAVRGWQQLAARDGYLLQAG